MYEVGYRENAVVVEIVHYSLCIFDITLLLKLESLRDVDGSPLEKVQLNLFSHIYEKKHNM